MPKISCVIPTKNRGDLIGDAIQSIIGQTEKDWELIVVDDHSNTNDKTEKVVKSFKDKRISYFKMKNNGSGVACARNFGNILAKAPIIAVMDSDDIAYPFRFELILEEFRKKKSDVVYGEIDWWDPKTGKVWARDKESSKWYSRDFDLSQLKKLDYIANVTSAYKRQLAIDFPYNSFYPRAEDWDFFLRLGRHGYKFSFIPKNLVKARRHKKSIIEQKFTDFDYDNIVVRNNKN